jgi:hypothetical protein
VSIVRRARALALSGEGKLLVSGIAAYRHAPPPPKVQRRIANRAAFEAHLLLRGDPTQAEPALRRAIELLVDAFLLDRAGNADCFSRAHRLGSEAEHRFGCSSRQDEHGNWVNECGVLALHSRVGQSVGGVIHTECSICGSSAFGCEHVEGEEYDGQRCMHVVHEWGCRRGVADTTAARSALLPALPTANDQASRA